MDHPESMRAIGYTAAGEPDVLTDLIVDDPVAAGRDLLVEVQAVSVNPVDTKVRRRAGAEPGQVKILGWDVAGVVRGIGDEVQGFSVGDPVWYAGAIVRPGANSELHLVDERLAARRPSSLGVEQAAALPLTSITAWELLFDRLEVPRGGGEGRTLLVVGAAGGVGSVLVQLARRLTGLRVIGTASRPETAAWVTSLGAHHVVDHSRDLAAQLEALDVAGVDLVASLTHTDEHFAALVSVLTPQGRIGLIDDPVALDATLLKSKSGSLRWESMFTRSTFSTPDMGAQGALLAEVAALVDAGTIRTTLQEVRGEITAAHLREAHTFIESGRSLGKIVLAGWPA